MPLSNASKGVVALILLSLGFSVIAITVRYLSDYFSLFQQLYLSLAIAFLISLFIYPTKSTLRKIRKVPLKDYAIMIFRVSSGFVIGASLYREALTLTKLSNVAFIQSIPFAAILGWILFKEKFTYKKLLLILFAYFGVLLISVKDFSSITSVGKGELFSLISAALFSLSFVSRKWQSDFLKDKEITQIILLMGTIMLFIISIISGEGLPRLEWQPLVVLALVITGFINAINNFFINYGFRNVKVVLASNILTLESVFVLALAFIFYREFPNMTELIGGIMIIISVIQMNSIRD